MAGKGPTLELAVLGLLHESPLHGYELRKRLNLLLGWSRLLSYGSLYPALKRMLRAGWITEVTSLSPHVSRRQRIVYQITAAGTAFFTTEMAQSGPSAWEDDNFNLRFAFFSRTDVEVRMRILEGRRQRLSERLDRARSSRGPAGADRYVSELQRHSIESVERELRWLTDLIDAERGTPRSGSGPSSGPSSGSSTSTTAKSPAKSSAKSSGTSAGTSSGTSSGTSPTSTEEAQR